MSAAKDCQMSSIVNAYELHQQFSNVKLTISHSPRVVKGDLSLVILELNLLVFCGIV